MQGLILRSILPHWGVAFLPLDVGSIAEQIPKRNADGENELSRDRKQSCDKEAVGELFLGGLGFALNNLKVETVKPFRIKP